MTDVTPDGPIPEVLGRLPMSDLMSDPYTTLANLREAAPAVAVKSAGYRVWVITRYDDVRKVMADPSVIRDFVRYGREVKERSLVGADRLARVSSKLRSSFRERDGDDHHQQRALVGHLFKPGNIAKLGPRIEAVGEELLDAIPRGQPVDLIDEFARPLAGRITCELTGLPSDELATLAKLETEMQTSADLGEIERSAEALYQWGLAAVEIKRSEPADDICTELLRLHEDSALTLNELASTYILFIVTGMQSAAGIGNAILTFLTHPDQLAKALAQPSLFTTGVDEVVRFESPIRIVSTRYATAPVTLGEVTIPAGELLYLAIAGGNRDPRHFTDPDDFDVTRVPTGHLGFGHGVHRCLGAQLAKLTVGTALEMYFTRFPETRLADPTGEVRWRPGKFHRRLDSLAVIPN